MKMLASYSAWLLGAALCGITLVWAQDYPVRPVRIVDAFPPGGGSDYAARLIASQLSKVLGQ